MKHIKIQFKVLLDQISVLLADATHHENPARYLFSHDLRTPLFYLEGLARIYAGTGPHKEEFKNLQEKFKLLEDMLGRIDYYEELNKQLAQQTSLPENIKSHFLIPAKNAISDLNEVLTHFNWLNGEQIQEIQDELEEVPWKSPQKEHDRLQKFYVKQIEKITAFAQHGDVSFTDMELGVHELRRKLRWLSIYAHALQGAIQLVEIDKERKPLEKYLTEPVLQSRFNKLPPATEGTVPLLLSQYNFYALSWMIGRLGELKDQGLTLLSLAQAMSETYHISDEEALQQAKEALGEKTADLATLLAEANKITRQFFKDDILKDLLIENHETQT